MLHIKIFKIVSKKLFYILLLNCLFTSALASTKTWMGTLSNDWNNASNWSGGLPTNGDDITIDPATYGSGSAPVISSVSGFTVKNIVISNGGVLVVNSALTVTGNITIASGGALTTNNSENGIIYFDGTTSLLNTGTFTFPSVVINSGKTLNQSGAITVNVKGNWTNNGGTFTANSNTVVFNGSGSQQINGTLASQSFYTVTIDKTAGALSVGGSTTTLTTNTINFSATNAGNFIAPVTLNVTGSTTASIILNPGNTGTFTAGTLITINGNFTNNSATNYFNPNGGLIKFVNGAVSLINGNVTTQTFYDFEIAKTAQSLSIGGNVTTLNVHNFTQSYKFNDSVLTAFYISGNFTHTSGTFVPCNNIYIGGNITDNHPYNGLTWGTTVTLNGSAAQTVGGGYSTTFNTLVINNTSSTGISLQKPTTISTALTLIDGYVYTDTTNLLIIKDNATSTSGSANSFVDGPIKKIGDDPFIFPTGNAGVWARLAMVNDASFQNYNLTTSFTCTYFRKPAPYHHDIAHLSSGIKYASSIEYWDLNRTYDPGDNAKCNVKLYWEDTTQSGIKNISDLKFVHLSSTSNLYENQGGTVSTSGKTGTITSSIPLTTFCPLTFGSGNGTNALPIELISFSATAKSTNSIELIWNIATETNNDYYTIERSADASDFDEIKKIKGRNKHQQTYFLIDEFPLQGINYYRLKQTDFDGKTKCFKTIHVQNNKSDEENVFYPNPLKSNDDLMFKTTATVDKTITINIIDELGKAMIIRSVYLIKGNNHVKINDVKYNLPVGIYSIVVIDGERSYNRQLIVR